MIKNLVRGSALSLALVLVPLFSSPAAQAAAPVPEVTTLADAVGLVKVTEEDRTGYTRTKFKHWNSGDDMSDGCNTRSEVLLAEAVVAPTVGAGCKLTGGTWRSYYDGQEVTSAGSLDIDHRSVKWAKGGSAWSAAPAAYERDAHHHRYDPDHDRERGAQPRRPVGPSAWSRPVRPSHRCVLLSSTPSAVSAFYPLRT
ncbi:hypothetical protein ACIQRC_32980 [Streptomyces californicus]|uniref:hypothetical protein n=1 Tax=Streptomyces californicus TaxID=67351 RepID=UPI0038220A45